MTSLETFRLQLQSIDSRLLIKGPTQGILNIGAHPPPSKFLSNIPWGPHVFVEQLHSAQAAEDRGARALGHGGRFIWMIGLIFV